MYTRLLRFCAVLLLPCSLFAQDSTARTVSTPFRRGQWATQFSMGPGFTSLGFLHFRSPTRALILDLRLSGAHAENLRDDSTGSHFTGLSSSAFAQLRFGWRNYRGGQPKVAPHYTIGVLAGFNHTASSGSGYSQQSNGWTWGAFADIGATYLVTNQLGLGALASAGLSYTSSTTEEKPSRIKSHDWQIGGSVVNAALVATLFF